jgi:UDP-N-acetyl-D-mannosaminuronic acid dehydrogenase
MKLPGMTAGTCLRKDFTFSEERSPAPGMLLAVSRVNESVPLFLVDGLKRRLDNGTLRGRKIAVLGLAFKGDTDDERDSLSFKLMRLLERELALVAAHDPHSPSSTLTLAESVADADAIVLATNHSAWKDPAVLARIADLAAPGAVLADPWNCFGQDTVFGVASELADAGAAAHAPGATV